MTQTGSFWTMDADGFSIVDNRAGFTFGVELYYMCHGMRRRWWWIFRRPVLCLCETFWTFSKWLAVATAQQRVTFFKGGMPVAFECLFRTWMICRSHIAMPELSELAHKWPPAVISHMRWRQRELEEMRKAAKVQYRKKQPAPCEFCGTLIRCDMYRHVTRCQLDLAQLWRCPVSWCTVWKGTPHVAF